MTPATIAVPAIVRRYLRAGRALPIGCESKDDGGGFGAGRTFFCTVGAVAAFRRPGGVHECRLLSASILSRHAVLHVRARTPEDAL
jgi:hypothetical protein